MSEEIKDAQTLPRSLKQLIAQWVDAKAVHLLQKDGKGHWRMDVDLILDSII